MRNAISTVGLSVYRIGIFIAFLLSSNESSMTFESALSAVFNARNIDAPRLPYSVKVICIHWRLSAREQIKKIRYAKIGLQLHVRNKLSVTFDSAFIRVNQDIRQCRMEQFLPESHCGAEQARLVIIIVQPCLITDFCKIRVTSTTADECI